MTVLVDDIPGEELREKVERVRSALPAPGDRPSKASSKASALDLQRLPRRGGVSRRRSREFLDEQGAPDLPHYGDDSVAPEEALKAHPGAGRACSTKPAGASITLASFYGRARARVRSSRSSGTRSSRGSGWANRLFLVGRSAMAGPTIIAHGTRRRRTSRLAKILSGRGRSGASCSASRVRGRISLRSRRAPCATATRLGRHRAEDVVLGGHYADLGNPARAHRSLRVPKHAGITYFLLDMKTPGIEIRPLRDMAGGSTSTRSS